MWAQVPDYNDWSLGVQNQFYDMHNYHPSYGFNAPEVTNEYNLLNDFLSTSLLDDGAIIPTSNAQDFPPEQALSSSNSVPKATANYGQCENQSEEEAASRMSQVRHGLPKTAQGLSKSAMASDKAREMYYLTAADPSGNDTPEERMKKLLKAKYDAGMLRPFNYVKGYQRLNGYMEKHMHPNSRQLILRQLERFRPTFRQRMQSLTDLQLVEVEMWFERSLMEYDRLFASMAIPACCWRRTGEIFRGNKEMAELIHVPVERLRDVRRYPPYTAIGPLLTVRNRAS